MTKTRSTKKSLVMSVLSLLLCVTMLVGTTFAWFTDSVTSENNIIKSGNLDIELQYAKFNEDGTFNGWADVKDKADILTNTLWEPGVTEVAYLRVANAGSLALKYQLGINIVDEVAGKNVNGEEFLLSDYINFGVVETVNGETGAYANREAAVAAVTNAQEISAGYTKASTMASGDELYLALVVYMPTDVGNEANHDGTNVPQIDLGINVFATQVENESDSFDATYDEDAWADGMQVYTAKDLQAALNNAKPGDEIVLMDDIALEEAIVIPAPTATATYSLRAAPAATVINLNGKNITIAAEYTDAAATASSAIVNNGNLVLAGNGTVKATNNYTVRNYGTMVIDGITVENGIMNFADLTVDSGNISNSRSGKHTIYGNNATLTINGGTFYNGNAGNATIFSYAGEVVINGGEFSIADGTATFGWTSCLLDAQGNAKYTINDGVINGEIRDYNKNTQVYGGTFTHSSVNNFIADGYMVNNNGDGTYTAGTPSSFGNVAKVNGVYYETLAEAFAAAASGATVTFVADVSQTDGILIDNKNITVDLNGNTFTVSEGASTNNRVFKITGTSIVTVKNGTLIADGELTSGAYGTIRTENSANVTLCNLKLYSYRGYGLNVKANTGTNITINDSEIYAQYSGGVEAAGGTIVLNNTKIEQTGVYSGAAWCSVAIGVNGGGKVTVNSGEYSASTIATDSNAAQGTWVAYVMSSGGTLEINGGTFNGAVAEVSSAANACGVICADRAAIVNIYGGTFNSNGAILDMRNNVGTTPNPVATIYGGTFSADPTVSGLYSSNLITIADGCQVIENDGSFFVGKAVTTADELKAAITNAKNGDVIFILNDITVTDKWDNRYGGKTAKAITINGLGNTLQFTGEVSDGFNYHSVFRFEGAAVVKNLTFDLSKVAGTGTWVRAISAASDLTVDNCVFIGSDNYTKDNAIVVGDINVSAQINASVSITNCTFNNWRRGISDNENAKEVKDIVISGNTFVNADMYVSAYESIIFTNNTMTNARVSITSYTNAENVKVTVIDNTLDANSDNVIGSASKKFGAANVTAQDDIVVNVK